MHAPTVARIRKAAWVGALALALSGCQTRSGGEPRKPSDVPSSSDRGGIGVAQQSIATMTVTLDARRSLAVTETAILSRFTLQEVLDRLVAQSGVPGLTSLQLFRQLWDTQNVGPGLGLGPHCDDQRSATGQPILNRFPYQCRPAEGSQAGVDPFNPAGNPNGYVAVGLFNRFDLAPTDGAHCGEYRIVFAKSLASQGRNLIIFEAVLPNPHPEFSLEGCRPVAEFWKNLTSDNSLASRADALKGFYFNGLPGFMPVVHLDNYGNGVGRATGQLRTNQFMQSNWLLREFQLLKSCGASGCALTFRPATDKTNPFGGLFRPGSTQPLAAEFQNDFFPSAVDGLAVNDVNRFNYSVPDRFNGGQSDAQGLENDYLFQFGGAASTFRNNVQARLSAIGSPLTPNAIVARAQALSCAGCHQLSNGDNLGGGIIWPSSLGFTHVGEFTEPGPEGSRFQLSPALTGTFLPHRKTILERFLSNSCGHDECAVGAALTAGCSSCADIVCQGDPFCCTNSWDSICVEEAVAWCGRTCP